MSSIDCINCGSHNATTHSIFWKGSSGVLKFWCGTCPRKCRVHGCTSCKPDKTHYCYVCKRHDVGHFSSACSHNRGPPTVIQIALPQHQVLHPQHQVLHPQHQVLQPQFALQQQIALQQQFALQQQLQSTRPASRLILGSVTPNGIVIRALTPADVIASRGGGHYIAPSLQSVVDAQRQQDAQQYQGGNIRWASTNFSPQGRFPF